MRYLVTGGAGFIGSNTVDELVRRGHSVVVLDDLSSGKEENLADVRGKITFVKGSIIELEAVQKAMHQAECVIHLAARTSVPRSVKDPLETNRINVEGTLNVARACRELGLKMIFFSSDYVFDGKKGQRVLVSGLASSIDSRRRALAAKLSEWVTMRTAAPSAAASFNNAVTASPLAVSRFPVGSSARIICGGSRARHRRRSRGRSVSCVPTLRRRPREGGDPYAQGFQLE